MAGEFEPKKILISSHPELLAALRNSLLKTSRVSPLIATKPNEVLFLCEHWHPDLVLLGPEDVMALCRTIKSSPKLKGTAVIAILPKSTTALRDQIFAAGCDDFLEPPLQETDILDKIEELIGIRFRRLPRYIFRSPATIQFKDREIGCQTMSVNRQMIFLQCEQERAPAVGKNVRVTFPLSQTETVTSWAHVERLEVRKFFRNEQKAIGILLRFLNLPDETANKIHALAVAQLNPGVNIDDFDEEQEDEGLEDTGNYESILKDLVLTKAIDFSQHVHLPRKVVEAFASSLTDTEREAFAQGEGDALIRQTVALRLKLLDALYRLRAGASYQEFVEVLRRSYEAEKSVQEKINEIIDKGLRKETLLYWSKTKYDIIRTRLEIEALERPKPTLTESLRSVSEGHVFSPGFKRVLWIVGVVSVILLGVVVYLAQWQPSLVQQ